VMGFQSENALVNVDWSENQLSINPNRLPIGAGRWVASPRVEFTPSGKYLTFDGGPVFENVDFTQEMSDTWLRYVSPILGSATSLEGKFSLSASPARVSLAPPYAGDFEGAIDIHSAQAGPGPLTRPIVQAIGGIQTILGRKPGANAQWTQVDEQRVPFHVFEGRVYHKDLKVGFGDVMVHSEGSVGLDETIDFQFTVPIPDKWTYGNPLLAKLQGEVIPFPMGGTLDKPQLDGRALGEFGKRIGVRGVGGLLQQLIDQRLEKKANGAATPVPRPRQ
jgi:translocation and assembly module TamB